MAHCKFPMMTVVMMMMMMMMWLIVAVRQTGCGLLQRHTTRHGWNRRRCRLHCRLYSNHLINSVTLTST